jgi:hypothetical protein
MNSAAARAAMRRGYSSRTFRPPSQSASSRAGGTRVVLPAPGGASSTRRVPLASAASSAGRIASIGCGADVAGTDDIVRIVGGTSTFPARQTAGTCSCDSDPRGCGEYSRMSAPSADRDPGHPRPLAGICSCNSDPHGCGECSRMSGPSADRHSGHPWPLKTARSSPIAPPGETGARLLAGHAIRREQAVIGGQAIDRRDR